MNQTVLIIFTIFMFIMGIMAGYDLGEMKGYLRGLKDAEALRKKYFK